jgi:hypothetical protein
VRLSFTDKTARALPLHPGILGSPRIKGKTGRSESVSAT